MPTNALVIYKSSAGSGKTYTLVLEYLKMVLKRPSLYRSILAITFTNKATEEMKSRIIGSLVDISENRDENLQSAISFQTGIPLNELQGKASKVLDNIMHDYSGFAVSTIDSFFSTIVRALARELHLPLRFDIELNTDSVINEISSMLMDEIGTNPWLKKWLEAFIFDKLDQGKSWKIESDIHELARELFKESFRTMFPGGHPKPDPQFVDELRKIVAGFESRMAEYGNAFLKSIAQHNLDIVDFSYGKGGVAGYISKLTKKQKTKDYLPSSRFIDALESAEAWATKKSPKREFIITMAANHLIPIAREISDEINLELPRYAGAKLVLNTIYIAGIYSMLDENLKIFRAENDLVLISDTNHLLKKSIEGNDAPFIYEKTGNRFTHYMLDEFQDTSDYQWQNLLPLIENTLSSGNYAMIVGDAKQSIYRWRGGNMQLLISGVQESLHSFSEITQLKTLGDNYRSREQIVNFNNTFFEYAPTLLFPEKENDTPRKAYYPGDLNQQWKRGKQNEGHVKIKFIDPANYSNESLTISEHPQETDADENESNWIDCACDESLKILRNVLALGFEFRDVAFLTRSNKDAKVITEFLVNNGISKIISPESMQLNRSQKIQFLINLLRYIDDPDDELVLSHIVYYWNVIRNDNNNSTLNELFSAKKKDKAAMLPESFAKKLLSFRKIPLYEAVEELAIIFGLGSPPEAYLQRFLDVILDYVRQHPSNITDFLQWWEENEDKETCSVIIPSGENAIRVMSIHKSKGLQFPVVIMPFTDWDLKPKIQSTLWVSSNIPPFDKTVSFPVKVGNDLEYSVFKEDFEKEKQLNLLDNLNVLYVAFTRAEEHLYVVTKLPSEKKKDSGEIPSTTSQLIYSTLRLPEYLISNFDENSGTYEQGPCSGPYRKAHEAKLNGNNLNEWFSSPWKSRLKMGISKKKISISDPETPESEYGLLFHQLVAEINSEVNVAEFLKAHPAVLNADETTLFRLNGEIAMFVDAALTHGWFGKEYEIVNEAELLLADGSLLRPDRLIIKDKTAIVIDYKTGAEENYHAQQVQQYASVLNEMGFSETKMFLVYPAIKKVVEVPAA